MEVLDKFASEADVEEIEDLPLPQDVIQLTSSFFEEFKGITNDLETAVEDRKVLEKMKKGATSSL
jgi:hypothetical protein